MKLIRFTAAIVFTAALALAQSPPTGNAAPFPYGFNAPSVGNCSSINQVGTAYVELGNPANGTSGLWICQQTGSNGNYGWVFQQPGSSSPTTGTVSVANGKAFTVNNTLTLAGTDGTTMTFPSTSATIARTDAANTFTGTQTVGALVATTINGNTFTTGTGTLTLGTGKTLTANNSLTLAGTDSTTMTFPTTSATIARTDSAQTFTGVQTFSSAPVIATITNTGTETLPSTTGGIPIVIACGATSGATANCANTAVGATAKVYFGAATLSSNASVITISPGFTSSSTYQCLANDQTTRANPVQAVPTSATTFTITNTTGASDVIQWACFGN